MVCLAAGSILVPNLVELSGVTLAFIVVGTLLPVFSALTYRRLVRADDIGTVPLERIELLRHIPDVRPPHWARPRAACF